MLISNFVGAALALQLGHRNSIDIDLFNQHDFSDSDIMDLIAKKNDVKEIFRRKNTIISLINNEKTDLIKHDYPLLKPLLTGRYAYYLDCSFHCRYQCLLSAAMGGKIIGNIFARLPAAGKGGNYYLDLEKHKMNGDKI